MGFTCHRNLLYFSIIFCCLDLDFGTATDTITSSQPIKDPETITSKSGMFTLGFFSPENSTNRYVGIWYKTISLVVWVANRNQSLKDSSGSLTIAKDGNLVVLNGQKQAVWSSNLSNNVSSNTSIAQLQDSGNLVLQDATGRHVWESFLHPTDTMLPGMKLITNNKSTGEKQGNKSWKSPSDPSIGNFSLSLERPNAPELFIWDGIRPHWRSGPWNGRIFTGIPDMLSVYLLVGFSIDGQGDNSVQLVYTPESDVGLVVYKLDWEGKIRELDWDVKKNEWDVLLIEEQSGCDVYGVCGAYGICSIQSTPICKCLRGFQPRNADEWDRQNMTSGCIRKTALQCAKAKGENGTVDNEGEDGFLELQMVKVPDFGEWSSVSTEDACRSRCLENCTCIAYSYEAGIGCMSWSGNLIDTQQFPGGGINLYVRVAKSELDKERDVKVIISVTGTVGVVIFVTCAYFLWKHLDRKRKNGTITLFPCDGASNENINDGTIGELSQVKLHEVLLFEAEMLASATNNFNSLNKLGEGGFGPVYKGKLNDSQEIAVKRLSRASRQGLEEFMNEVSVISKLQHRNLVRLLGCCIEGDDRMLIYEYMPNKSLDTFIFDPPQQKFLDWRNRFSIIEGIARGLLYLHRDSRLRIIHRDLKAGNILLDEELNPKISNFGLARIFGGRGDQANTKRVVGTYGYMAPEYAMEGLFSEKSDVFSFGVLLLEIVSARKNSSFYNNEQSLSLLGFAWKLWNEENIISLIGAGIRDPIHEKDILRCVHIGLLCVQEIARDRPTMSTVISMLNSEIVNLPRPSQPAFILRERMLSPSTSFEECFSNNYVSNTEIKGR